MRNFILLFFTFLSISLYSQVFTGSGGPILDNGTHNYYPITVGGLTPTTMDTAYGLETVCINLNHPYDDDLMITLLAPDGTEVDLSTRNGGGGDNYTNTCFNHYVNNPITSGVPPFTGTYKAEGSLAKVNNGQNPNGIWKLHIYDVHPLVNTGTLLSWSISLGSNPAMDISFTQAKLPLVVINTSGQEIYDEPKIMATMKIINNPGMPNHVNDPPTDYSGWIGIELRGNSSMPMPKKSYTFETRYADASNNDVPLLGMPVGNDWVLVGNYADKSLLRNYYTYFLYRKMGHWAPRMQFCELVINGDYKGIYILGEKIKRGNNRVDIHALHPEDTSANDITGGYIFKLDWEDPGDVGWYSNYPAINAVNHLKFLFDYPNEEDIRPANISYMKSFVDGFELSMQNPKYTDTINGYRKYIDVNSFIDYIILMEVTKNLDGYRLSMFFSKDRNGKIKAGPPWDYDLAYGNGDFMEASLYTGWNYTAQANYTNQCPYWWSKFFGDVVFQDKLNCRWLELRQHILNPQTIRNEIDSLAAVLSVSIDMNFWRWPILGIYVWPNPYPIPQDYAGEIQRLKDWADHRIPWLDNHWQGVCNSGAGIEDGIDNQSVISLYPNPNQGSFTVSFSSAPINGNAEIQDITGKIIYSVPVNENTLEIKLKVAPGLYFLRYINQKGAITKPLLIQN